jgi:hypothetical protein
MIKDDSTGLDKDSNDSSSQDFIYSLNEHQNGATELAEEYYDELDDYEQTILYEQNSIPSNLLSMLSHKQLQELS